MKKILPQRLKTGVLLLFLLIGSFAFGQTTATYSFSDGGAVTGLDKAAPGISVDTNIGFGSFKNGGTANPALNNGQLRLYQNATKGGSIKIYANNGVTITKVVINASGSTGPAGYTVDGGVATNLSISGGTYTMSDISATSVVEFYQRHSSTRIYVDSFEVTYITSGPSITNILQDPLSTNVTPSSTVSVSANITDPDGIASATLYWGTTSGSRANNIAMSNSGSGDIYTTISSIQDHSVGTKIYYEIEAINNNGAPEITVSAPLDYTVIDPYPLIANITQNPTTANVTTLDAVEVTADITSIGGIADVELYWGTVSGNLTNTISMTLGTGDSYTTNTSIPAQVEGTIIYYEIAAMNNESNITTSDEQSYTVTDPSPVIGTITQNPTAGNVTTVDVVAVTANITTSRGTITTAELYWGTTPGNLTNPLTMTVTGNSYTADIPVNIEGTTVYYEIRATNSFSKNATSAERSYTVINPAPVIANIVREPSSVVTPSDSVLVSADITDNNGIASVELRWGTVAGVYTTTIAMTLDTGNSYVTVDAIPAQPDGTTVYYVIEATDTDSNPATTTSEEQSYTVMNICGSENFDNAELPSNGYGHGSFVGNNGVTWTYVGSRDENGDSNNSGISGNALMLRRQSDGSKVTSSAVSGGISDFSVKLYKGFTGGGNRQVELFVNEVSYGLSEAFNDFNEHIFTITGIDIPGDVIVEIQNVTGNQIIVDDITWTCFETPIDGYVYDNGWSPEDPSGIATALDNITVLSGIASLTENTTANNITINTGATLNIEKVLTIAGDITIDGDLVFVSSATGNGELAAVPSTSTITGQATVQSYMSNNRSYRMVSSSVTTSGSIHDNWQEGAISNIDNPNPGFGTHITGTTIDQTDGFDGTVTGAPSMFTVDPNLQSFVVVPNTDVKTLVAGDAYLLFVRGDRSIDLGSNSSVSETVLRAKGTLHTGYHAVAQATPEAQSFAMFGNPYQSAVDINSAFGRSDNVNTAHYYVYDPSLGTHGSYVTVTLPNGTNTSESAANQYLQPGQAAQFNNMQIGSSAVFFEEEDKAPGNFTATSAMGNRLSSDNMLTVQLYTTENFNNGGKTHDSFGIIFGDGFDNEVTHMDALKPMNFYENLGIDNNGTYLSIERREMPGANEVYSLYSSGYQYSDYTLKLSIDGLDANSLYLEDYFMGTSTLLESGNTIYNFTVDKNDPLSIDTGRFAIRTEARLDVNDNNMLAGIRLYPNPLNDSTFYINAPNLNGQQLDVNINDLSGRVIYKETLDCQNNMVVVPMKMDIASGIYLVTLNHGGESHTIRLIKK